MNPVIREYSKLDWACRTIMPPMCSIAVGSSSNAATVASIDSMSSLKWTTAKPLNLGRRTSFRVASVIVTRVPSEPTTKRAMSRGVRIEKLVEVVAGDSSLNLGVSLEDLVATCLSYGFEPPVEVSFKARLPALGIEGVAG